MTGGMDVSRSPLRSAEGTFSNLLNLRHPIKQKGVLEQTPYFTLDALNANDYYYNGATATAPATSRVIGMSGGSSYGVAITDYSVFTRTVGRIQCFHQTYNTSTATVYTGCLLVINSVAGLAITLGSLLEVEMTAVATFRWRKNGGGWTAGLTPSTAGVSIDGGNATLYFLANTGFAGTETWSWRRTDMQGSAPPTTTSLTSVSQVISYGGSSYFVSSTGRIMKVAPSLTSNESYCISVGYRAVNGTSLRIFEDHLVVGGYSTTALSALFTYPAALTVAWSDLRDFDNFIPTDTNEADSVVLRSDAIHDSIVGVTAGTAIPDNYVLGMSVIGQQLFVHCRQSTFVTSYIGLPLVFSFHRHSEITLRGPSYISSGGISTYYFHGVCQGAGGVFLVTETSIAFFNGGSYEDIGAPVSKLLTSVYGLYYNDIANELLVATNGLLYCYQLNHGTWYTRASSFTSTVWPTVGMANNLLYLYLGAASLSLYQEDVYGGYTPAKDVNGGSTFATPTFVTQLYGVDLHSVKELFETYLMLTYDDTIASTYYSIASNIYTTLSWHVSTDGTIGTSFAGGINVQWGLGLCPRVAFNALAIKVVLSSPSATKPGYRHTITAIEESFLNYPKGDYR